MLKFPAGGRVRKEGGEKRRENDGWDLDQFAAGSDGCRRERRHVEGQAGFTSWLGERPLGVIPYP